jgi:uncharacterized membrane protein
MSDPRVIGRSMEGTVAKLLRAGVIISGTVVALGGAVYLIRHGGEVSDYHTFKKLPAGDRLIPSIISVLLLIATPVARVAVSLVGFAREHDRKYVVITAIVLSVLLYSLISGALGLA